MFDKHSQIQPSCAAATVFENSVNRKRPLWAVIDVAQYLRVSERTVRDWIYQRKIPFLKVGRCVRFDPAVIESWATPSTKE